jgi:hypothetical protein
MRFLFRRCCYKVSWTIGWHIPCYIIKFPMPICNQVGLLVLIALCFQFANECYISIQNSIGFQWTYKTSIYINVLTMPFHKLLDYNRLPHHVTMYSKGSKAKTNSTQTRSYKSSRSIPSKSHEWTFNCVG